MPIPSRMPVPLTDADADACPASVPASVLLGCARIVISIMP